MSSREQSPDDGCEENANMCKSLNGSKFALWLQGFLVDDSDIRSPKRKKHPELTPVTPKDNCEFRRDSSCFLASRSKSSYKLNDSMVSSFSNKVSPPSCGPTRAVSMTRLDQLAKPRQRYLEESLKIRNSKSRASTATSSTSVVQSPIRPTSSLSGTSERSTTSSVVVCRRKTTARKPRPVSIGGCFPDCKSESSQTCSLRSPITPTGPSTIYPRASRARSIGSITRQKIDQTLTEGSRSSNNSDNKENTIYDCAKPVPPRKPAHVKAAAAARRLAKLQQSVNKSDSEKGNISKFDSKSESRVCNGQASVNHNNVNKGMIPERKPIQKSISSSSSTASLSSSNNKGSNSNAVKVNVNENKIINNYSNEESDSSGGIQNGVESETSLNQGSSITSGSSSLVSSSSGSKKITSEEEYKRILAEKRRLAREQAEREAKAERLREEEARKAEQERLRQEEERLKREEEEQLRLAEEHRRIQQEKLRQAMQEQRKREEEDRRRLVEEARLKAEREEQEARAKEEAERARLELEERLRKDEEERLLRKKKVEAIMSRTRKAHGNKGSFPDSDGSQTPDSNDASPVRTIEESKGVPFQTIYLDVRD